MCPKIWSHSTERRARNPSSPLSLEPPARHLYVTPTVALGVCCLTFTFASARSFPAAKYAGFGRTPPLVGVSGFSAPTASACSSDEHSPPRRSFVSVSSPFRVAVAEAALALASAEAARDEDRARFGEALDAAALDAAATLRRAEAGFDADRVRFDDDRTQFAVAVAECRAQVERRERAAFRAITEANAARRFANEAKCVGAVEQAKADARRDVFEVLRGMGRPSAEELLEREENEDDGFGTRKEDGDDDGDARDPGTPAGFRRMPQEPSTPPPRWAAWARSWERERAGRRLADARRDARAYRQTLRGLD